jgi:hypothetical protein
MSQASPKRHLPSAHQSPLARPGYSPTSNCDRNLTLTRSILRM